jgi:hypothetical protein
MGTRQQEERSIKAENTDDEEYFQIRACMEKKNSLGIFINQGNVRAKSSPAKARMEKLEIQRNDPQTQFENDFPYKTY